MRQILSVVMIFLLASCTGVKDYPANSEQKKFSPALYATGESLPAQFKGQDWNPSAWPLSYQNKEKFTQNLFDADIIRRQYIKGDTVPIVVVGRNFYHLSDQDQGRICQTLDMLYGATSGKYGHFVLKDWYSKKIIGEYTKSGLTLR